MERQRSGASRRNRRDSRPRAGREGPGSRPRRQGIPPKRSPFLGLERGFFITNFLLLKVGRASELRLELLKRHKVCVRDCASFGLPQYIRVGVRNMDDNRRLADALKEVLGAGGSLPKELIFVLGGARSGKSAFAERLAALRQAQAGGRVLYVATAEALDADMERRIANHRCQRPPEWDTLEEPLNLASALPDALQGTIPACWTA